jgi:hypothetical protein
LPSAAHFLSTTVAMMTHVSRYNMTAHAPLRRA